MARKLIISLVLLIFTGVCSHAPPQVNTESSTTPGVSQITEISLKVKYAWFTNPPNYEVTLRPDGTVVHIFTLTKERRQGKVNTSYFHRLARFIESQRYFELKDVYGRGTVDADVFEMSVVRGGVRKTVVDIGSDGPPEPFGIALAIDGVVSHVAWAGAKPPPLVPRL